MLATAINVPNVKSPIPYLRVPSAVPAPSPAHVLESLAMATTTIQADRDAEIIAQGETAEYCFQVVTGCVRTVKLLEDGRRQVGAFLFAGDVFGWETEGVHAFAAEAVTPVTLRRLRLGTIEDWAANDRVFSGKLRQYIFAQIRVTQDHLVLLGRKTAAERIASFLLRMRERLGCQGSPVIELPMSRTDMADYLGLTIETVCRGLTELRRHGIIEVDRTRIVICDPRALGLAGSDRLH